MQWRGCRCCCLGRESPPVGCVWRTADSAPRVQCSSRPSMVHSRPEANVAACLLPHGQIISCFEVVHAYACGSASAAHGATATLRGAVACIPPCRCVLRVRCTWRCARTTASTSVSGVITGTTRGHGTSSDTAAFNAACHRFNFGAGARKHALVVAQSVSCWVASVSGSRFGF